MKTLLVATVALLGAGILYYSSPKLLSKKNATININQHPKMNMNNQQHMGKGKVIYFAGGCFWGTEYFFQQVRGVIATEVGYANGNTPNPSYKEVCNTNTGFAETVKVTYDPTVLQLEKLIDLYFKTIDPTSLDKQGNDRGTQYRTGIYFDDPADSAIIAQKLSALQQHFSSTVVVENLPLKNFYTAEEYHQDYLEKNPGGYCHIPQGLFEYARNANPEPASSFVKPDDQTLRKQLTPLQYEVTQNAATEMPFQNEYNNEFREGIYVDITTGEPLFVSTDKFKSGCGWPSFSKPINKDLISEKGDYTHGMSRIEVRSKNGNAHLGHVFNDGPKDKGGLRFCINSASLKFIPKEEMIKDGYEKYLSLLEKN